MRISGLCRAALAAWVTAALVGATPAMPEARADAGEEFLIVDCLLPGQIRRLGAGVTYVAARKAVKTSAGDCEIRGGEYVAYDRSNYATALKTWLPLAEDGDAEAMVYVGEIFEKGLGLPSDPQTAAKWYRAAAEAGSRRGAVNLGSLYEQGLGVAQDPEEALRWYRMAAGVPGLEFSIEPASAEGVSGAERAELESLRSEVGGLRRELEAKQHEIEGLEGRIGELLRELETRRGDADAERAQLDRLRAELEASRRSVAETVDPQVLAQVTAQLTAREQELASYRDQVARLDAQLGGLRAEQAAADSAATDALQGEIDARAAELGFVQTRLGDAEAALAATRQALTAQQGQGAAQAAALHDLETEVGERERRLAEKDSEIAGLRQSLAGLEQKLAEQESALAEAEAAAPPGPLVELIEPELATMRGVPQVTLRAPQRQIAVVGKVLAPERLFSLTVNGETIELGEGPLFRTEVPLSGEDDQVRIVAVDKDGASSTIAFTVLATRATAPRAVAAAEGEAGATLGVRLEGGGIDFGTYHALIIGNDDYRLFPPLKTAKADARQVAEVLERIYGFQVTLLLDASRYDILSAMNALREQLTDADNLLVYYAGHGELDRLNQRGHWLPVDAEPDSSANWISNIQITDILNAMSVRQLMVVADSCYSGTLTRNAVGNLAGGESAGARAELIASMVEQRSRMVLTSGGLEPVLDAAGGQHSIFAGALVEALERNAGVLAGQELFGFVLPRVVEAADEADFRQVPEYAPIKYAGHESGDFFFVRKSI